jgi:hypothetical protein
MTPESLSELIGRFAEQLRSPAFGPEENRGLNTLKNDILAGFKTIRFPSKDEKDVVWQVFQTYLDQFRVKQADLQQSYLQFAQAADGHLESIEQQLDRNPASAELFKAVREAIAAADAFFRQPMWPSKEDRENAWAELRLLRDRLRSAEDYFYAHQREELQQKRQHDWRKKQHDFLRMLEEKLFGQKVFREKVLLREPQHREFIGKLEQRLKNQAEFLHRIHGQREELQQKLGTADSPIYKARLQDWIAEKNAKSSEIERDMAQLREKIAEVEVDIQMIPLKVEEVDQSIADLEAKVQEVKAQMEREGL